MSGSPDSKRSRLTSGNGDGDEVGGDVEIVSSTGRASETLLSTGPVSPPGSGACWAQPAAKHTRITTDRPHRFTITTVRTLGHVTGYAEPAIPLLVSTALVATMPIYLALNMATMPEIDDYNTIVDSHAAKTMLQQAQPPSNIPHITDTHPLVL